MDTLDWYRLAERDGWDNIAAIIETIELVAKKLDGKYADPLVECSDCGAALLNRHYRHYGRHREKILLEVTEVSWSVVDNDGTHHCHESECRKAASRLTVVRNSTVRRRRKPAGGKAS